MSTGVLRYWNNERCFGFIKDDGDGPDTFAAIRNAANEDVQKGARVEYEAEMSDKGPRAKWWRVLDHNNTRNG